MPADHRNPNVQATAARHLNNAMRRVHPAQRLELLQEMQALVAGGISIIETGRVPAGFFGPTPGFADQARDLIGVDLSHATPQGRA